MYKIYQRNVRDYKYMIQIEALKGYQKDCVDITRVVTGFGLTITDIDNFFKREIITFYNISPHGNFYFRHERDAEKFKEWLESLEIMRQMEG